MFDCSYPYPFRDRDRPIDKTFFVFSFRFARGIEGFGLLSHSTFLCFVVILNRKNSAFFIFIFFFYFFTGVFVLFAWMDEFVLLHVSVTSLWFEKSTFVVFFKNKKKKKTKKKKKSFWGKKRNESANSCCRIYLSSLREHLLDDGAQMHQEREQAAQRG